MNHNHQQQGANLKRTRLVWGFLQSVVLTMLVVSSGFAQAQKLTTYGFFDLEAEGSNKDPNNFTHTFDQHHFNVVSIFQLNEQWRIFGEIEWEHGIGLKAGGGEGQVALERGWIEYAHTDGFKVKAGKFLPPFGFYNLFHDATPVFLSTFLPAAVYGKHSNTTGSSQRMFSKFGTGVQVLGTVLAGEAGWQLDYYAYLINGRGPKEGEKDNDKNKGVGGRFMVQSPGENFRAGLSFYQDDNGNRMTTSQRSIAADISVGRRFSGLFVEAEAIIPRLENVDAADVPNGVFRTGLGYYVQASYATDVRVTPFARYDFFDPDGDISDDGDSDIVIGLNYRATSFAFLKGQIQLVSFQDPTISGYENFIASISIAF